MTAAAKPGSRGRPGPGRPSPAEPRDTRRAILDAALDLFSEKGFAATSVRDLASAVGLRESTLYHHFPGGKEQLLDALVKDLFAEKMRTLQAVDVGAVERIGLVPLLMQITRLGVALWTSPREEKIFRLLLGEAQKVRGEPLSVPAELDRLRQGLKEMFAELIRLGRLREVDPGWLALVFLGPLAVLRIQYVLGRVPPAKLIRLAQAHTRTFCSVFSP